MSNRSLLNAAAGDFRRSWKELALTDIAYKIIAFVVLTPLVAILFRVLIAVSGKSALARSVLEQRAKLSAPERLLLELAGALGVVPEIGEQ